MGNVTIKASSSSHSPRSSTPKQLQKYLQHPSIRPDKIIKTPEDKVAKEKPAKRPSSQGESSSNASISCNKLYSEPISPKICGKLLETKQSVRMSPEEMASQELAQWRENEANYQLEINKKLELDVLSCAKNYVSKTHKGEEVIAGKSAAGYTNSDLTIPVEDVVSALTQSSVGSSIEVIEEASPSAVRKEQSEVDSSLALRIESNSPLLHFDKVKVNEMLKPSTRSKEKEKIGERDHENDRSSKSKDRHRDKSRSCKRSRSHSRSRSRSHERKKRQKSSHK
uniref:Uncharacterized protein n=1 Tax=Glossina palpalis gambiensis TaxID=67801 RepID=A0A1B0BVU6_9MUSC